MGLLSFGKGKETYLAVVTDEGGGKLRLNGVRSRGEKSKREVTTHARTVCWIEFAPDGVRIDQGMGRAATGAGAGQAERLLRQVPMTPTCRDVLERLRNGQESVGKWLELGKATGSRGGGSAEATKT